jgi:hypothetical protein
MGPHTVAYARCSTSSSFPVLIRQWTYSLVCYSLERVVSLPCAPFSMRPRRGCGNVNLFYGQMEFSRCINRTGSRRVSIAYLVPSHTIHGTLSSSIVGWDEEIADA